MAINFTNPGSLELSEMKPRITVFGVGGAGCNAVSNMIQSELGGVDFVVANTDAQSLALSKSENRIQMGAETTQGLGAGAKPEVGRAAAEEVLDEIVESLKGSHMVFITAGMGGGTGTGGAPVVAKVARELGVLTVGVVTKPFQFEGMHRMRIANAGVEELEQYVDTLITIPNQNLFRVANEKTTFAEAFKMADDVLHSGVRSVTDLMVKPGQINLDFADIRSIMAEMGRAMMGTGEASGERRALDAAESAISNPLIDEASMRGAKGVLINITGGTDVTLLEIDEAAECIRKEVDQDALVIFGSTFDDELEGKIRISVVATGMDSEAARQSRPTLLDVTTATASSAKPALKPQPKPDVAAVAQATMAHAAMAPQAPAARPAPTRAPTSQTQAGMHSVLDILRAKDADKPSALTVESQAPVLPATQVEPSREPDLEETTPGQSSVARTLKSFIPPKPMTRENVAEEKQPDSFGAAAVVNGGVKPEVPAASEAPKPKKPSLFEQVTGMRRAKFSKTEHGEAPVAQLVENKEEKSKIQPTLAPLDPAERISSSEAEEDLLDIPAFLRRSQAN